MNTDTPPTDIATGARDVDAEIDRIVADGPSGAFAVAGVATALVLAMVLVFYVFAYLPRGVVQ